MSTQEMSELAGEHQGNSRHSVIVPYRVGFLADCADQAHLDLHDALLMGLEEIRAGGALDRDVLVEHRATAGAPNGSVLNAAADWRAMNADGLLIAMVGPFGDENGAALAETIETEGMPTLTLSPNDSFTGPHIFQLPFGHPGDVAHRLIAHANAAGAKRLALVREPGPRGAAMEHAVRVAAWQLRVGRIEVFERNSLLPELLRSTQPDAILYLGGKAHAEIGASINDAGIAPLRLTGTEICRAHAVYGEAAALECWTGLAMTDPKNRTFQAFSTAFASRHHRPGDHVHAALGYDIGRLLGMVLAHVRPPSPAGVRDGLDRMRMVLSATGAAGTVISFTAYDHRGFKGDPMQLACVRGGAICLLPEVAAA